MNILNRTCTVKVVRNTKTGKRIIMYKNNTQQKVVWCPANILLFSWATQGSKREKPCFFQMSICPEINRQMYADGLMRTLWWNERKCWIFGFLNTLKYVRSVPSKMDF